MNHTTTSNKAYYAQVIFLALVIGIGLQIAQAWTVPTQPAPNGNVSAPITTGEIGQIKTGNLAINTAGTYANGLLIPFGNVGIGTINPVQKLDVTGGTALRGMLFVGDAISSDIRKITAGVSLNFRNQLGNIEAVLNGNGNLGINTITPTEKLEVAGNAKVSGVLSSGKVQLVDVATENTACTPNGLVARDNIGAILNCQSLVWKKLGGSSATVLTHDGIQYTDMVVAVSGWNGNNDGGVDTMIRAVCPVGKKRVTQTCTDPNGNFVPMGQLEVDSAICSSYGPITTLTLTLYCK